MTVWLSFFTYNEDNFKNIFVCCLPTQKPGPLGQLDMSSNWYLEGGMFDPRSHHISFVEIW